MAEPELDRLREENMRLKALVDSFGRLNSSIDLDKVLNETLKTATSLMQAEIGSIALLNDERSHLVFLESTDPNFDRLKNFSVPLGKGIAGHVAETGQIVRVDDVRQDDRFYSRIDHEMQQKTSSYICAPLIADGKIIGTAQLMNRIGGGSFTAQDEDLLEGFARQAALAIHNAQMHALKLRQQAFDSEMRLCADIQLQLFPKEVPGIRGFELFGFSSPASDVGGDYYGFITRPDNTYDIVVADISGKGISASLMVSEFHTGYQLLAIEEDELLGAFNVLNRHLMDSLVMGRFITAFGARLAPGSGKIDYVLAGHNPPFVIQKPGNSFELERTGFFLGLEDIPYRMGTTELEPGALLIAFSDGYPEAKNPAEELFGEERMLKLFEENFHKPLNEIHIELEKALDAFRETEPHPDDRTIVLLRKLPH